MSSSTRVRNTYSTAAMATLDGALKLSASCAEVPVKSTSAVRASGVDPDRDLDLRAVVQLVFVLAVVQGGDDPAHRFRPRSPGRGPCRRARRPGRSARPCARSSAMPCSLAAIWARRSARLVAGSRDGYSARVEQADGLGLAAAGRSRPAASCRSAPPPPRPGCWPAGIEPGRDAADLGVVAAARRRRTRCRRAPGAKTGVTTVMSGRWVPPW